MLHSTPIEVRCSREAGFAENAELQGVGFSKSLSKRRAFRHLTMMIPMKVKVPHCGATELSMNDILSRAFRPVQAATSVSHPPLNVVEKSVVETCG